MRPYTSRMTPPFTMIGSSVDPDKMKKDSPGESLGGVMPAPDLPKGLSKSQ